MRMEALVLGLGLVVAYSGCAQNPMALQAQNNALQQKQVAIQQQNQELQSRVQELDRVNQDMHAVVAESKREAELYANQVAALRDQLTSASAQLAQLKEKTQLNEKQVEQMAQATRRRSGAIITANSSLQRSLPGVNLPGVEVRTDGDLVRIELPCDKLFSPGGTQLTSTGTMLIDSIASEVARTYSDQMIGLEGHTDSEPVAGQQDNLQFSATRALAVYQYLTSRRLFTTKQLFTVGHGPNHPVVSNATPTGRARNSRIEMVIYPDKVAR
jgi:flagellar motor protein MotB